MSKFLDEVRKLNSYYFGMAVLRGIHHFKRRKSEYDGMRGVLSVGGAGTGKTTTMQQIYKGLELNKNGLAYYLPSGMGTGIGLLQLLQKYNNNIIFIDELLADTVSHQNVLKQIIGGSIGYMRYNGSIQVEFKSLVIGATNGIKLLKNTEHMIAMLDRFSVVKMDRYLQGKDYFDLLTAHKQYADFSLIKETLHNAKDVDLTTDDRIKIKEFWREKSQENLDPTRNLNRQCLDYINWFGFIKSLGITDYLEEARDIANNTIVCNPVHCIKLSPIEKIIYSLVEKSEKITYKDIIKECAKEGMAHCDKIIYRTVENLVVNRIVSINLGNEISLKKN